MDQLSDHQCRSLAVFIANRDDIDNRATDRRLHAWVRDCLADLYGITQPHDSLVAYCAKLTRLEWQLTQTKAQIVAEDA